MLQYKTINDKPCSDHEGNIYPSLKAMCLHWNIRTETFSRRIKVYGMSLEEALTKPVKTNGGIICYDHNGDKYYSETSMCGHWGILRKVYEYRINHGWTQEQALTTLPRHQTKNNSIEG